MAVQSDTTANITEKKIILRLKNVLIINDIKQFMKNFYWMSKVVGK